jgi:hypothetical protein
MPRGAQEYMEVLEDIFTDIPESKKALAYKN